MSEQDKSGLSHAEITRICGDLLDGQVQAILATGASLEELEEAVAYASGEDDIMGEERKPLAGRVAQIYDILTRDEAWDDEGR